MSSARSIVTALSAVALVATVAGCTPAPAAPLATPSASPVATVEPSESPSAEPVVAPLSIPDCESLLPLALAKSAFGSGTEYLGENPATDFFPWYQVPAVLTAIDGVSLGRNCWWGVPQSDGAFSMLVAEIDPATRASIEAGLTAEGFTSVTMGTVTAYEAEREGMFSLEAETHLFTGDVWILGADGSLSVSGTIAGSALDALRTANPTLGL